MRVTGGTLRTRTGTLSWALLLLTLCADATAHAQVTGTLSGYVKDQNGGAVPGATVTTELTGQQLVRSTTTNAEGFFDLQALPRGEYQVKVEMSGFETQVRRNVALTSGANVRADFTSAWGDSPRKSWWRRRRRCSRAGRRRSPISSTISAFRIFR